MAHPSTSPIRCVLASLFLFSAQLACAQTWVPVSGGGFPLDQAILDHIQATLELTITTAASSKGRHLPEWKNFTLQYRPELFRGHRIVRVQGSCKVSPGVDLREEFYEVMDGGECFFWVTYDVENGRFSNVLFHGYA